MAAFALTPGYDLTRHGERRETVVRYRPYGRWSRILFTLLFCAAAAGGVWSAFFTARTVTVDGDRGTSMLTITKVYPLLGTRRESHDLASILGTGQRSHRAKNGGIASAVTLRTAAGEEVVTARYATYGRTEQKQALDAFLADPGARELHLPYDQGSPLGFIMAIFSGVMVWLVWTLWQEASVRFEWWRDAVVLERRRWPAALWSRAFQAGEITGARVQMRGSSRKATYRVLLTLGSGEEVPLLTIGGSGPGLAEAAADELRAALAGRLRG